MRTMSVPSSSSTTPLPSTEHPFHVAGTHHVNLPLEGERSPQGEGAWRRRPDRRPRVGGLASSWWAPTLAAAAAPEDEGQGEQFGEGELEEELEAEGPEEGSGEVPLRPVQADAPGRPEVTDASLRPTRTDAPQGPERVEVPAARETLQLLVLLTALVVSVPGAGAVQTEVSRAGAVRLRLDQTDALFRLLRGGWLEVLVAGLLAVVIGGMQLVAARLERSYQPFLPGALLMIAVYELATGQVIALPWLGVAVFGVGVQLFNGADRAALPWMLCWCSTSPTPGRWSAGCSSDRASRRSSVRWLWHRWPCSPPGSRPGRRP